MKRIGNCLIIIGILIFIIGLYFMFFKAGIPYPDPTPEMTKKWIHYYNVGKVSMPSGAVLSIIGIAIKTFIKPKKR